MESARLTRRGLLIGAGAAGALVVALTLVPGSPRAPLAAGKGERVIDGLVRLERNGMISVAVPALEMGQGITTLAAQIVAVELGADWSKVGVEPAPLSPFYADPVIASEWAALWLPRWWPGEALADTPDAWLTRIEAQRVPSMITAGGTTIAAFEPRLRAAAAALRAVLVDAGARAMGVSAEACDAKDHHVVSGQQKRSFVSLINAALDANPPSAPTLRIAPAHEAGEGRGTAFPRLDLPAKADGSFVFAGDVRLPDMVFAAIAHGPLGQARLASHDAGAARNVPGLVEVIATKRWLAAVGQTWHAADRALAAMNPRWHLDPGGDARVVDSVGLDARIDAALAKGTATRLFADGDPDDLMAHPSLAVRYDIDPAPHAPLETATATARFMHGRLELWLPSQAPAAAAMAAARGAGISPHDVTIYPMAAGGAFDARLDARIAEQAGLIAAKLGRPVQVMWSRWQEMLAGYPRAPLAARMEAAFDSGKARLLGWRARIATPPAMFEQGARLFGGHDAAAAQNVAAGRADALALSGAMPVYAMPERAVDHVPVALPLPVGRLRGGPDAMTAFLTESFIDECAHFAGAEPLSFRVGMLGWSPRLVACLEGAARMATWDGGGKGSGQGIACHMLRLGAPEGERLGLIAVVAGVRAEGAAIRVDSLHAYADIGRVINRDIARQQIEGGLIFGMAHALGLGMRWSEGKPVAARLVDLALPALADCPKVEVAFAPGDAEPFDPGELGMAAVAPAIANALFSASGVRLRRLPLSAEST